MTTGSNFVYYYFGYVCLKIRQLFSQFLKEKGKKKCVSLNTYYKTYKEDLEKTDIGSLSDGSIPIFFDIIITDIISQIKKAFAA